jgi:hypothetical protein
MKRVVALLLTVAVAGCGHAGADPAAGTTAGEGTQAGQPAATSQTGATRTGAKRAGPPPRVILKKFDADHDGAISAAEADAINAALAEDPRRPIAAFDTNGDGKLDEREIAALNERLAAYAANPKPPKKAGKPVATTPAIDCAAGSGTATISWKAPTENADGSPLKDLAGYVVRYGPSPQSLACHVDVKDSGTTKYVVEHLGAGTWYFVVAAVNRQGVESPASTSASKTIK